MRMKKGVLTLAVAVLAAVVTTIVGWLSAQSPNKDDASRSFGTLAEGDPSEPTTVRSVHKTVSGLGKLANSDSLRITVIRVADEREVATTQLWVERHGPVHSGSVPVLWSYGPFTIPNEEFTFDQRRSTLDTVILADGKAVPLQAEWVAIGKSLSSRSPGEISSVRADNTMSGTIGDEAFAGEGGQSERQLGTPPDKPAPKRPA